MVDVGDIAVKVAGRDAGKLCAVIDIVDNKFVLIDGETRRRKCNVAHLEFLGKKVKLKKGASSSDVLSSLKELGLKVKEEKKGKSRDKKEKPMKVRKVPKGKEPVKAKKKESKK